MKEYEALVVLGPNNVRYRIPKNAKEDWDSWIDLAGERWTPPLYCKAVDTQSFDVV